jgi:hypothetical protein
VSLRVVSVEGNSHWRTDSREIALLEVGSDALPRQSGHRSPEALNAAWVRGRLWIRAAVRQGRGAYRLSSEPSPQEVVLRLVRSDDATAALVEVLAALKLSSSRVTWVAPSLEAG